MYSVLILLFPIIVMCAVRIEGSTKMPRHFVSFYRNYSRPSKSFSSSYFFGQNYLNKPIFEKSECGSRTVNYNIDRNARIVGGAEVPYGLFPWQVQIEVVDPLTSKYEHHCGGAVLSKRLVLTAAHCFDKQYFQLDEMRVITGQHVLNKYDEFERRYPVERVIKHPDFRKMGPHSNDIALVIVRGKDIVYGTHVRPVCLTDLNADVKPGVKCIVSGWGKQDEDIEEFSPVLRAASVPILDLRTCRDDAVLGGRQQPILDSMLCAGVLSGGVDACGGDSGGPLTCYSNNRWFIAGIVSWGDGCARKGRPGVYTRVGAFATWIRKQALLQGIILAF